MNGKAARQCRELAKQAFPKDYREFRTLLKSAKEFYYKVIKLKQYKQLKIK